MGLFFSAKKSESLVLVEIGPDSIAGGLAYFKEGEKPLVVYTHRAPIERIQDEEPDKAAARTLAVLGEELIREGVPQLAHVAGSGRISSVLVSVKAPWQETSIRSEKIERTSPFPFTKALVKTALAKSAEAPTGRLLADEFIVGTVLDGYETRKPIGKRASRANIIVLSSFIDDHLSMAIAESLRKFFHTTSIRLVAAAAIRYEALRAVFPHEQDYLTVDIAGTSIVTTLVRRNLLSAVEHASSGNATDSWMTGFLETLESITQRYPLPRKILLLTNESDGQAFKERIEKAPLSKVRLSEEPPVVVPVIASHLTEIISVAPNVNPDLGLELMAGFWIHRES